MTDDAQRARLDRLERENRAMLARVKQRGLVVRPVHIDKLAHSTSFNHGRKRTI